MPLYEYQCKPCNNLWEEWKKSIKDVDEPVYCPICGKEGKRLMSVGGFKINGYSEANGYSKKE